MLIRTWNVFHGNMLVEILRACGFDVPLELVPYDPGPDERRRELQMLSPERRLDEMLERREKGM